jgi:hypothetical protein
MNKNFWSKTQKQRGHMEDLSVDGRIILRLVSKWRGVNWIYVAQDGEHM